MGKRNLLAEYKRRPGSLILRILVYLAAALTLVCIAFILIYILAKGIPNLTPDLFKLEYTSDNCSMLPALVNTLFMTLLSLLIAGPIGIFAAIYLVEYAKSGNKLVGIVRITAETLTGIPSICIWFVRNDLIYDKAWMGIVPAVRCVYTGDYGASGYHENNRRSLAGCSKVIQRRKLWTWCRKTSYSI